MSDETIVLHKYLHLLWSDLSMALWTIILCVGGEEREGGQGRKGGKWEKQRGRRREYRDLKCTMYITLI